MKEKPVISIWKDQEDACIAAAHYFVSHCRESIAAHGRCIVSLSGGQTPKKLYEILATEKFSRNIPWKNIYLIWGDERFVPHTDKDSNFKMTKESLLDKIQIPSDNVMAVPILVDAKHSAREYEKQLRHLWKKEKPRIDLLLLGMGNDGHTASLFPGTSVLKEKKKWVREVWSEEKQNWRISLTLPLINQSRSILFLVTGGEKAEMLARVLQPAEGNPLPAQMVKAKKGNLMWMIDEMAAAKI